MASGSIEYNYVIEPDVSLQCLICLDVAKDPLQHEECGKLFCKECIEKHGKDKPCPHCKTQGLFYQDKKSQRDVLAIHVKCNDINSECNWEGTVGTLEEHVATCEFALVPCPKWCQGSDDKIKHFANKALDEHLQKDCPNRDFECEYCGEKGTFANITQDHDKTCEKQILPCPNADCTDTIQRQGVKRHLEDCIYTEVPCKYQGLIGCDVEMKRYAITVHEDDDKLHLDMALDKINEERQRANLHEDMAKLHKDRVKLHEDRVKLHEDRVKLYKDMAKLYKDQLAN